jgi:hypothetical protein
MLNYLSLTEELLSCGLDLSNAVSIIKVKSSHNLVLSVGGSAWHGEHETFRDSVSLSVRVQGDALPLIASKNPIAHVVNRSITS